MRRLLPLLPLLVFGACAQAPTGPPPGAWIGSSEAALVAALGVPNRSYDAPDNRRLLAYDGAGTTRTAVVPSIGFGVGRASGGWGSATGVGTGLGLSFGPYGAPETCTTTFEIQGGLVAAASRNGPGCE
jgi:hypothetical protein